MGQAPQILQKSGIHVAAFGRGSNQSDLTTKFLEMSNLPQFSEMYWQGADGSRDSVFFANWYSNGNEIPVDKDEALAFGNKKIGRCSWLCLHQPMVDDERLWPPTSSTKFDEAIRVANELFPDVTFIHSSFDEYVQAVKVPFLNNYQRSQVNWPVRKRMVGTHWQIRLPHGFTSNKPSKKNSNLLEQVVEPLTIITGGHHHKDQLTYAWKTLLQKCTTR